MTDARKSQWTDDGLRRYANERTASPLLDPDTAAELLAAREALRAADALADEIDRIEDHVGKQTAGYVYRYRAARGAR